MGVDHYNFNKYQGNYEDGKREGWGKYEFEDGSVYEGNWNSDEMNGVGTYRWVDGAVYEGQF